MASFHLNTELLTPGFFSKKPLLNFLIHWIAWILLYSLTYTPTIIAAAQINWPVLLFNYVLLGSVNFLLFYSVAFYLLPQIGIKKKRWIWLALICVVLAVAFSYIKFRIERYHLVQYQETLPYYNTPAAIKARANQSLGLFSYMFRQYFQSNIYNSLAIIFVAFAYRLLITWYLQEKIKSQLESQKLRAELSFLKMQVNPHFLFNALNNIYSLAVIEDSKKTGNSILKLSNLMRYMLYEKEDAENKVSLDKEIHHINNYIDLEKLRHLGDIYVNFSIEGDLGGKRVAPLLLFPLIENAFKHGILTDPGKPVNIEMKIEADRLKFHLDNYINNFQKDKSGGIGLENVKKRLELLYGKDYILSIDNSNGRYTVNLDLPL